MANIQSPRGTRDILPADQPLWQLVRNTGEFVAEQMGFQPITVPTYESIGLFQRSIGQGTDIMDKELFLVRSQHTEPGKEEYALRPEGTAGIARAFIEHGMNSWPQPVKLYSIVNNFRYDRPQKGRYREHTQISLEYLGDASAFADAWLIYTTYRYLKELGLNNVQLLINTLGTTEERMTYRDTLRNALMPVKDHLSHDSQQRLAENPLRILDSKDENDQSLLSDVPSLKESLGDESKSRYAAVLSYLDQWNVPYQQNDRLVRGLDYYCHTAFEWVIPGTSGQQNSLGGGGRYDGLIHQLGGAQTPAVGAGIGLDRVMEALAEQQSEPLPTTHPDVFVIAADEAGKRRAPELIDMLLDEGWSVDAALDKEGVTAQLKLANRTQSTAALIIGTTELERGEATLKLLASGEQHALTLSNLNDDLSKHLGQSCTCDCCSE